VAKDEQHPVNREEKFTLFKAPKVSKVNENFSHFISHGYVYDSPFNDAITSLKLSTYEISNSSLSALSLTSSLNSCDFSPVNILLFMNEIADSNPF